MKMIMTVVVVALLGTGLAPGSAMGQVTPAQKCSAAKLKASGKKALGKFKCLSKLASKGTPVDTCYTAVEGKFMDSFASADALVQPPCEGTASSVETAIDDCIDHVSQGITGSGKCQGSKMTAAGKKASGILNCYKKAATAPPFDQTCPMKASDKFSAAFDKADAAGACPGDKGTVETQIDNLCVTNVVKQFLCGNGTVDPGETCDDGNTVDGDDCPSNCVIQLCTPTSGTLTVSVKFTPPPSPPVGGAGLFVDYPEGAVRLPTTSFSSGVSGQSHDRDYGITEEVIDSTGTGLPASPNALLHLTFKTCQGAPAPTAADFKCTVNDASDENGVVLNPSTMSCTVTIP
jgi:cysteine-rich repeat protein